MRIWVTGIGIVSPLGADGRATMDRLLAGERAQRPVSLFDTAGCRSSIAAEVPGLSVADVAPRDHVEEWSRTDAMALTAAREALGDVSPADAALILGGTTAGMFETEGLLAELHGNPEATDPLSRMLSHPLSATADRLREVLGPFRRAATLCSACSSGANALLLAASWLRTGRADRVLAGGADGLCRLTYTGFSCLGALSPEPCKPFDALRDGLNLGEGAAFLLLESEAAARARGAEPIAELRGWAVGSEAHHITNPESSGETAAEVMRRALARAGVAPGEIGYVNAHGTATRLNDAMEAAALRRCFGAAAETLAVSSTKGQIGHTLGAAGAIEAAVAALAIARGELPPTAGLVDVDGECGSLLHLRERRAAPGIRAAMSSSFGFGGSDAVVVLARPGAFDEPEPLAAPRRVMITGSGTVGRLGFGGTTEARGYLAAAVAEQQPFDPKDVLDSDKARRMDRAGRLVAASIQAALRSAGVTVEGGDAFRTGAIVGGAFGSIDACAAFVHRFLDKGARFAMPAVFPSLLPSSPVAHASIYLGLRGAVFSLHDLAATAESAFACAAELIAAGEADRIAAGAVEQASPLVERVLAPLFNATSGERGEGTGVLLLEAADSLGDRAPIAELAWWHSWRGQPALADLPPPARPERAAVIVAHDDLAIRAALAATPWAAVPILPTARIAGHHEAAGALAAAAALSLIATSGADEALLLALPPDRGTALLLRRVGSAEWGQVRTLDT